MSLDVWFKDDIRNTLLALNETSHDTHAQLVALCGESALARSYRSGYGDALRAVAIAFGISVPRALDDGSALMPRLDAARAANDRVSRMTLFGSESGG